MAGVGLLAACGGGATSAVGVITQTSPALCIGRAAAAGVCLRGGDRGGRAVGDCVSFRYTGTVGLPKSLRVTGPAKASDHRSDCPAGK
jgi:hypothetical protein